MCGSFATRARVPSVYDDVEGTVGAGESPVLGLRPGDHENVAGTERAPARKKDARLHCSADVRKRVEAHDGHMNCPTGDANAVRPCSRSSKL